MTLNFGILKPYLPEGLYVLFIFGANVYNYKKSPIYISRKPGDLIKPRILLMASIKSMIYTSTLPLSASFILYDAIFDQEQFNKHFIPFSTWNWEI